MEPTFYKPIIETDDFNNFRGSCIIYQGFYYKPSLKIADVLYVATANEQINMNQILKIFNHRLERYLEIVKERFPNLKRGIE